MTPAATFTPTPTTTPTLTPTPNPNAENYFSVAPCRILDTRLPDGPFGGPVLTANTTRDVPVTGICGIPLTARALALNVTDTQPTAPGNLTIYPSGLPLPLFSTINYATGRTRANNAIVSPGTNGKISIYANQATGTVHVIVDVNGYFQ